MKRTINYLAFSVLIFLFGGCCQKKNTQHAEKISVDKVHIADYGRALFYLDPMDVKKGDRVLYGKYSGTEVKLEDETYLIIHQDEILGILG